MASIEVLAAGAPTIASWRNEALVLRDVTCYQVTLEMRNQAREAVLPPSLHPTIPAALSIQLLRVGESEWGAFEMGVCRISCRSGVRARGFTSGVYATPSVVDRLCTELGFPARPGEIRFDHNYSGTDVEITRDGVPILSLSAIDPDPMEVSDVQYTGTLNLAHTPNGLRLVQVEAHHRASRVERLVTRLRQFEGEAWGNALLVPSRVIASTVSTEEVEFPPIRFVCKPDELAFTGTESVAA